MSGRSGQAVTRDHQSTSATSRRCNKVHSAQAGWTFLFLRRLMRLQAVLTCTRTCNRLNAFGVIPLLFLNSRLKYPLSSNPHA
jgi:hypothetical protein